MGDVQDENFTNSGFGKDHLSYAKHHENCFLKIHLPQPNSV